MYEMEVEVRLRNLADNIRKETKIKIPVFSLMLKGLKCLENSLKPPIYEDLA